MRHLRHILVALLVASPIGFALADGKAIAERGLSGVPACVGCHGPRGMGDAGQRGPRLAGQHAAYIVKQLEDFRAGRRDSTVMGSIAAGLTTDQTFEVADWFSRQQVVLPESPPAARVAELALGGRLAAEGKPGVPACVNCHGRDGWSRDERVPRLAGQLPEYLTAQIEAWRHGARRNDKFGIMQHIASSLKDEEVAALALYYARQDPVQLEARDR